MTNLLQDLRYALRQLRKSPAFLLTAVATLALGVGATTAVFSLIYQVILRSMPVAHPEQLYKVGHINDCCVNTGTQDDWHIFSFDLYRYLRDHTPNTEGIAAVQSGSDNVSFRRAGQQAAAEPLDARFVSGNYFSVLGVRPLQGRLLTPEDDHPGAAPAAVISNTLWQTRFASDPHLVGSTVLLTNHPITIVGIAARGFLGERNTGDPAGLWLPLSQEPTFDPDRPLLTSPGRHWLDLLVRIPHPKQVRPVEASIRQSLHQWILTNLDTFQPTVLSDKDIARQTTELASASGGINDLRDQYGSSLTLLFLVAGSVLLIACANLASLMLVRGIARRQELAIRSAIGAPRRRLVAQMLVESLLLAILGGLASIVVAYAGTRGILALALKGVEVNPLAANPSLPVLGFALAVSFVTGILFGIAPALIGSRSDPTDALRGANRSTRDATALPQRLLVIAQAALSLALLSTAGLLLTSLRHLEHQNFRFQPEGRLLATIDLGAAGYTNDRLAGLYSRFDDTFSRLPSVQSFAYATYGPMAFDNWSDLVFFPGDSETAASTQGVASYTAVSQDYFQTIGTRVLLGRPISPQDTTTSPKVAVVNQTFADQFLKGKSPLGGRFGSSPKHSSDLEIVGVVEDTKYRNPNEPVPPMYFTPITQNIPFTAGNLIVHYRGDSATAATSLREALKSIDPNLPITHLTTYTEQLRDNFTQEHMVVDLTSLFGLIALALAAIGLYGVTAYAVARRTGEVGIRMALGATRGAILNMFLRSALAQAALGFLLGIPLALAVGRLLGHFLYQTSPFQPAVLLAVTSLLLAATVAAALIPARRAAHLEPTEALRTE